MLRFSSRWYKVDYSGLQTLPWGYHMGCAVAKGRCSSWGAEAKAKGMFCSVPNEQKCTGDNFAHKGYCNLATFSSSLPSHFQYFSDSRKGGRDQTMDYCPSIHPYSNGDCRNPANAHSGASGELWGTNSRCFESNLYRSSSSTSTKPRCYRTSCKSTYLEISVKTTSGSFVKVVCPKGGGRKSVSGFSGTITCPPFDERCGKAKTTTACPSNCNGRGACGSNGKCNCNFGYKGSACELRNCLNACSGSDRGDCDEETGECTCKSAYASEDCSTCADGYAEKTVGFSSVICALVESSAKQCSPTDCNGNGECNKGTGKCNCHPGYAKADCSEKQSSSEAQSLTKNKSKLVSSQTKGIWAYFVVPADLTKGAENVTIIVRVKGTSSTDDEVTLSGDADVCVSTTTKRPSQTSYEWKSAGVSDETITVPSSRSSITRVLNNDLYVCSEQNHYLSDSKISLIPNFRKTCLL